MRRNGKSQCNTILAHLERGGTITPLCALNLCGTLALHSRISELRKRGHLIHTELIRTPSGKYVGKYSLEIKLQERRTAQQGMVF